MKINIDLESDSVSYEDIGAKPRARRTRRRVGKRPRVRRPLKQDPFSKLKRKRTNLRNGIKKRLDGIRLRSIPSNKIGQARQEIRSMFQDFKRVNARYEQMKKRQKSEPKRRR